MKEISTQNAAGHVLCHDVTRIVKDEFKGPAFRKGHVVTPEDIPVLLSMGKQSLYVWEKQAGMLHENEAAEILYDICTKNANNLAKTEVKEGKIEVLADEDGLFLVDTERLAAINSLGEMMIATRRNACPVKKGWRLAGTRVIPLIIEEAKMQAAQKTAGEAPILQLLPYTLKKYAVITTGSEVASGLIEDTFTPVIRQKLAEFGCEEIGHTVLGDEPAKVTEAINSFIAKGAQIVLCTGGMSVDPDDKTPLAIKNTGADIVSYGAPTLPGAMFLLSYLGDVPVLGLPGCVMYAKRTIFDLVLPRVLAGQRVTKQQLAALGHGGLCLGCDSCIFPNCAFGAGI